MQNQNRQGTLTINGSIWFALLLFNFLSTRVLCTIKSRRDILDEAAEKLLESEVIEGKELKALADAVSQSGMPEDNSGASQNSHALAA